MKILLLILFTQFKPVWHGNGYAHMNIHIVEHSLCIGDTIGAYSGLHCVGAAAVESTYVNIIASSADGRDLGFVPGDTIVFATKSNTPLRATYYKELPHWVTTGKFEQNGSAFVRLDCDIVTLQRARITPQNESKQVKYYTLLGQEVKLHEIVKGIVYIEVDSGVAKKILKVF